MKKDEIIREHDDCIMAVHKETGKMFGGSTNGAKVGYSKIGHIKTAMTVAKVNHDDYFFVKLSFTEGSFSRPTPTFTYLE